MPLFLVPSVYSIPNSPDANDQPILITNKPIGGDIGTAETTVDISSCYVVEQTTVGQTLTLPDPTNYPAGRLVTLVNAATSTTSFVAYGVTVSIGFSAPLSWDGVDWRPTAGTAAAAVNWGAIGGTLSNQADLQTQLNLKATSASPSFTGAMTSSGVNIYTPNAMAALSIDVTKGVNTKTIAADQTFTFSGTPSADTWFTLIITNSDTASHIATIPSSVPEGQSASITTVTVPASSKIYLTWRYDGSIYQLFGAQFAGRHMIPIMAAAMAPSASGGCAALANIASAANQPDIRTLDFDQTTAEYAQFSIPMPESWDEGTLTFQPIWSHAAAASFAVIWGLQAVAISNDDPIAVAYGTAVTSTDTGGTTNDIYVGPESSAMTVAGTPAAGDMVFFRIYRDAAAGGDTLNVDARLHGIRLYYTTNAETDQ